MMSRLNQLNMHAPAVGFDIGLLIVRDIPYLDEQMQLKWGAIVSKLVDVDGRKVQQDDHQIYFAGSVPYNVDGTPVGNLGGGPHHLPFSPEITDVVVERSFSNKPTATGKYDDVFHGAWVFTASVCIYGLE